MYTRIHVLIVLAGIMFILADTSSADVPAPPVNQNLGIVDFQFGDQVEADCRVCHGITVQVRHDSLDGQSIPPGSLVPYRDVDGNGLPDPAYSCESCHGPGFIPGSSPVERDCTACHNTTSPHHQTPEALARNCVACHGDFVDNADDGHDIPSYSPSLITPWATDKSSGGQPANSRGTSAGSCNYCHDDDGLVTPKISKNAVLHHETGLYGDLTTCQWCHDISTPSPERSIRTCQSCHGFESLHNIQADSPNPANIGSVVVGGEDAGYGHVGRDAGPNDSDCWGCHGFSDAVAFNPKHSPNRHHVLYGKAVSLPTEAPFDTSGGIYVCFSCHDENFTVIRNCKVCHTLVVPRLGPFLWNMVLPAIINTK